VSFAEVSILQVPLRRVVATTQMINISDFGDTLMILGPEAKITLLNMWFSLIVFSTSSVKIHILVDSKIYGILMIFKKDFY